MNLNPRQFPRLFDPGPRQDPQPNLGDLSSAQWHGTTEPAWDLQAREQGWAIHSGTPTAAESRMSGTGAAYPVWPQNIAANTYDDGDANRGQANFEDFRGREVPASVESSANPDNEIATEAAEHLITGHSIRYDNYSEDIGSISYISPPGAYKIASDADLGLARGTGWKPRTSLTRTELAQAFPETRDPESDFATQPVHKDPRLFEEVAERPGEYFSPDDVNPGASRSLRGNRHRAWKISQSQLVPGARSL